MVAEIQKGSVASMNTWEDTASTTKPGESDAAGGKVRQGEAKSTGKRHLKSSRDDVGVLEVDRGELRIQLNDSISNTYPTIEERECVLFETWKEWPRRQVNAPPGFQYSAEMGALVLFFSPAVIG
jgi:hypothetical protein